MARCTRSEAGTAAVEFAMVLPIVAVLACGVIDYGQAVNLKTELNSAARAGAQYALAHPDDGAACTVCTTGGIAWAAHNAISTPAAQVTVAVPGDSALGGTKVYYCTCGNSDPAVANQVSCTGAVSNTGTCTGIKKYFIAVSASQTYTTILPYPGLPSSIAMTGSATVQMQ